uniref:DUF4145 domain-containing protein n=1 Tax=Candidatus Kentrum sp. FM TaxID=2126340 RepID=A0A450THF1_9GAMM|nr:MAG: protein of unknown function (DUF4145) [Candidatus Kentron sp. FM]VFJ68354.1 MAG: protein of unknown function (DUF4145) [Candidatus Kentron sp. FM]VFK16384.1 MAG: protein of unknown function (DUF4145) [Candidatus Kentron sp. FM]
MNENTDTVPAINKTAFSCPHCGAYTTQSWSRVFSDPYPEDYRTPFITESSGKEEIENNWKIDLYGAGLVEWEKKVISGALFIDKQALSTSVYFLGNVNISQCYNCEEIAIWARDRLIYPGAKIAIQPNQDLPSRIKGLFEEAREIVASSPKGAAALLRLGIQHLCKELGESGKNINQDIANLVKEGLDPRVQQALDIVRVIGNEAVHPGKIDLDDNRDTALRLFDLVNLICDRMITHPKQEGTSGG